MGTISKIQEWYKSNCNSEWEHNFGISIDTLDNPGWSVEINLVGTKNENKKFKEIKLERDENNWIHCSAEKNKFLGYGGPNNLEEILEVFLKFVSE